MYGTILSWIKKHTIMLAIGFGSIICALLYICGTGSDINTKRIQDAQQELRRAQYNQQEASKLNREVRDAVERSEVINERIESSITRSEAATRRTEGAVESIQGEIKSTRAEIDRAANLIGESQSILRRAEGRNKEVQEK